LKTGRKEAIDKHCIGCGYDEDESGGKLQQVAICKHIGCDFFHLRPVPRECWKNGDYDEEAIEALREVLAERDRVRRERETAP
jgi:hypothetical protein